MALLAASALVACDDGGNNANQGSGGATSTGGAKSTGGVTATGGSNMTSNGGSGTSTGTPPGFGTPTYEGMGSSMERYAKTPVRRNGGEYLFMANGWGPGFTSQTVSWEGTSFTVDTMEGKQGSNYEPASYPTVFCGYYSDSMSGTCGLPKATADIHSLYTGWKWQPNGNAGQYNAAYDIWISRDGTLAGHSGFLMVWLRDPPGQQPAGSVKVQNVAVPGVPGMWNIWVGTIGGKPYVAYVRPEGQDVYELEFDVMAFWRDASSRPTTTVPGSYILSVAVGFEIWNGPITNLESSDFYVEVK